MRYLEIWPEPIWCDALYVNPQLIVKNIRTAPNFEPFIFNFSERLVILWLQA